MRNKDTLKMWYRSRTLWLNIIAITAMIAQAQYGFLIDAEAQAAILAILNLILRAITEEGLEL